MYNLVSLEAIAYSTGDVLLFGLSLGRPHAEDDSKIWFWDKQNRKLVRTNLPIQRTSK